MIVWADSQETVAGCLDQSEAASFLLNWKAFFGRNVFGEGRGGSTYRHFLLAPRVASDCAFGTPGLAANDLVGGFKDCFGALPMSRLSFLGMCPIFGSVSAFGLLVLTSPVSPSVGAS